jgi:hypothetical protein
VQGLQDEIKLVAINLEDKPAWYKDKVYHPQGTVKNVLQFIHHLFIQFLPILTRYLQSVLSVDNFYTSPLTFWIGPFPGAQWQSHRRKLGFDQVHRQQFPGPGTASSSKKGNHKPNDRSPSGTVISVNVSVF